MEAKEEREIVVNEGPHADRRFNDISIGLADQKSSQINLHEVPDTESYNHQFP
jgi:hypothetical protein